MADYRVIEDELSDARVLALLAFHLADIGSLTPAGKMHALPLERLRQPDVTFYSAWQGEALAAIGALCEIEPGRGEIKSMRAAPAFRGQGAGEALLLHLLGEAKRRAYHWIGLETGRPEPWRHARNLYRKHGFTEYAEFGDYADDGFSLCMSRAP